MSTIVTAMNTANTTSSTTTMSDWARSTTRDPTALIATIATHDRGREDVVPPSPCRVREEERGRVTPERDRDHRGHDHDRREVPEPGRDPDETTVPEPCYEISDESAGGWVSHAELDDGVAKERGDHA